MEGRVALNLRHTESSVQGAVAGARKPCQASEAYG